MHVKDSSQMPVVCYRLFSSNGQLQTHGRLGRARLKCVPYYFGLAPVAAQQNIELFLLCSQSYTKRAKKRRTTVGQLYRGELVDV